MQIRVSYLLLLAIVLFSCSKSISYLPTKLVQDVDAPELIRRVLLEQPRTRHFISILDVEVTDEYFSILRMKYSRNAFSGQSTTYPSKTTVFYENINRVLLYKKTNYIIRLLDIQGSHIIDIYCNQKNKSEEFINALYSFKNFKTE